MNRIDVIMDIDSVGDDILALLYAAKHPRLNLLGVTTVTGASGDIEQATWVALNTLDLIDSDIPVHAGASEPIVKMDVNGDPVNFFEELRPKFGSRIDEMNVPAARPTRESEVECASDYLVRMASENPGKITLVTTGPLTNIALALEKDSNFASNIKEAYVLGGAFRIWGNISPVTEYNIVADAEAANMVMNSGMKITLVPLDVCENNEFADGMMTRDHIADLDSLMEDNAMLSFIKRKYPIYIDVWREYFHLGGFPMDDVITAALVADSDLATYSEPVHVDVETKGSLTYGETIAFEGYQINRYPQKAMRNVRIARTLDGKRFMDMFVDVLSEVDCKEV